MNETPRTPASHPSEPGGSDEHEARPQLWNPNAAGLWSLILTPAFGAYLHASNWRALGNPERAQANMVWVWVHVIFLVLAFVTLPLGDVPGLDRTFQITGLVLLILWFYFQCKPQMEYVKAHFGDGYERKGWGMPLCIGASVWFSVIIAIVITDIVTYEPGPDDIIDVIQPQIIANMESDPAVQAARIQEFTITPSGESHYTGDLVASLDGEEQRFTVKIHLFGDEISWRLIPLDNP